ncbi:MAG TPA: NAD(P)H-binding protein [Solirubrobacteraceae bacterium]
MRIAVIGATGWLGGAIVKEALSRGHQATAIGRDQSRLAELSGVDSAVADVRDADAVAHAISGHDVVVSSVTDRSTSDRSIIPAAARSLIEAVPRAGVPRLAVVGGGGSLNAPDGGRLVDQPGFPDAYKAEALAQGEALDLLRSAPADLDWTYMSPPPHDLAPGEKRGGYTVAGGDDPVGDGLTSGDLADAFVDELEQHRFSRQRFTAGY